MTTVMQPFQCDLQPEIPKHPITTHTQPHPKQLHATVTLRKKLDDGWPESVEEQSLLLLVWRH